jgi:hypothetical protein
VRRNRRGNDRCASEIGITRTRHVVHPQGYYHVRTVAGEDGWLYGRYLDIASSEPEPAASPPAGVADHLSPSWGKPEPNHTQFTGASGV